MSAKDSRFGLACNAAILVLLLVDRATKAWARGWLQAHGPQEVLPFFHLTYVENTGAAFGIGHGANTFFVLLAAGLGLALYLWRERLPERMKLARFSLSLVIAGALGNIYDRIVFGYVVDFLDFRVWPVFNVADSAICVGAGLLAWSSWKDERMVKG